MNKDTLRQWINVIAYVVTVIVNGLATSLPLNGQTTGEISDRFPVYFTPANYVFAIWGVIYLGLLGFTIYQALPSQRGNPRLRRIGYLPALSGILNTVWIFLWHYNIFELTVAVMLGILLTLIAIYLRLDIGRTAVSSAERWLVNSPFSVYLGWITVATIANVTTLLYYLNWDGFGISPQVWAVAILLVGAAVASTVILSRRDAAYAAVIVWAYAGIIVKQADTPVVAGVAAFGAAIVALALILTLLRRILRPRSAVNPA
jgi:hypothetical protein